MNKRVVYLVALVLFTVPSFAQIKTGIKGGVNLSNINMNMSSVDLDIYKPRFGMHVGFIAEYMFSANFGLQSELTYVYSGANIKPDKYTQGIELPNGAGLEGYLDMHTLQLPLYLKTKFEVSPGIKMYVMGGGFATYSPLANQHVRLSYEGESIKFKWSLFDGDIHIIDNVENNVYMQQRWNAGLCGEIGVEMTNNMTVGIGFRHILNNMAAFGYIIDYTNIKPNTKMWTATISVGYLF